MTSQLRDREGFLSQAVKDIPESIELLDYAEIRGIAPAEVRELQRETLGAGPLPAASLRAMNGKSVPEQRKQVVDSFIHTERARWDLSFVPEV